MRLDAQESIEMVATGRPISANSVGDRHRRLKIRKRLRHAKVRLLLLAIGLLLCILAASSVLSEAISSDSLCYSVKGRTVCQNTHKMGYWAGAVFALLSALFSFRLFFTRDNFSAPKLASLDYSRWLLVNEIFATIALCAHLAMFAVNAQAAQAAYNDLKNDAVARVAYRSADDSQSQSSIQDADANPLLPTSLSLSPEDTCYNQLATIATDAKKEWKATSDIIVFFAGCAWRVTIASLLILCDSLQILVPLAEYVASRARRNRRRRNQSGASLPAPRNPEQPIIANSDAVAKNSVGDEYAEAQPVSTSALEISKLEQEESIVSEIREITLPSCLYELAKATTFFPTLEATFGVKFMQNATFNPQAPATPVTITCETGPLHLPTSASGSDINPSEGKPSDDGRRGRALDTLRRFVDFFLRQRATELSIRFPVCIRDRLDAAPTRVSNALSSLLRDSYNCVQLEYNPASAKIGLLCYCEAPAAVRALEYTAHRRLRSLVFELDDLFETRHNVNVFLISSFAQVDCRVFVYDGDVWRAPVDFVVNSLGPELQFDGATGLANAVHSAAGVQLRSELERVFRERGNRNLATGELVVTDGCQLAAARILHVHSPNGAKEYSKSDIFKLALQELYAAIFDTACTESPSEASDLKLALPLLSAGDYRGGHRVDDCIDPLLRAIANASSGALRRFSEVHIVDRDADKITRLLKRIAEYKTHFVRENEAGRVKLVRAGCRPFAYADPTSERGDRFSMSLSTISNSQLGLVASNVESVKSSTPENVAVKYDEEDAAAAPGGDSAGKEQRELESDAAAEQTTIVAPIEAEGFVCLDAELPVNEQTNFSQ